MGLFSLIGQFRLAMGKNQEKVKKIFVSVGLLLTIGFLFQNCGQPKEVVESSDSSQLNSQNGNADLPPVDVSFLTKPFIQLPHSLPSFNSIPSETIYDAIAFDNHVIVATPMGLGVSHDNGVTFKTHGIQNGFSSNAFSRVEYNEGNLYVLNGSGIDDFKVSSDMGDSFQKWQGVGPNGQSVYLSGFSDFCLSGQYFYISRGSDRYYYSADHGKTFIEKDLENNARIKKIFCQGNKIVFIFDSKRPGEPEKPLFGFSYDNGLTFTYKNFSEFETSLGLTVNSEFNFAFAKGRMYLHQGSRLLESLDHGLTFSRIYAQNSIRRIARFNTSLLIESAGIAIVDDTTLPLNIIDANNSLSSPRFFKSGNRFITYYPKELKLVVSSGTDASSTSISTKVDFPDYPLQAIDYIDETLYVLAGNGLFASEDEGLTFKKLDVDCKNDAYRTFGYNSGTAPMVIEKENIYIVDSNFIYISTDKGLNFEKKSLGASIRSFFVSDGRVLVLLSNDSLAVSLDDGKTFQSNVISGFQSSIDTSIIFSLGGVYISSYGKVYYSKDYFATPPVVQETGGVYSASMYLYDKMIYFRSVGTPSFCLKSPNYGLIITECELSFNVHFGRKGIYPRIMIGQNRSTSGILAVSLNGGVDFIPLGIDRGIPGNELRDIVYNEKKNRIFVVTTQGLVRSYRE